MSVSAITIDADLPESGPASHTPTVEVLLPNDLTPHVPRTVHEASGAFVWNLPPQLAEYEAKLTALARQALSVGTLRVYNSAWRAFVAFCEQHEQIPLPAAPNTIATYLAVRAMPSIPAMRPLARPTIEVHRAAIIAVHKMLGHEDPAKTRDVEIIVSGIRRTFTKPPNGARALVITQLRTIVEKLDLSKLRSQRDAVILLVGFAGAFRRSELVALNLDDLDLREEGYIIKIRRSKTDQLGLGRQVVIPYSKDPIMCPVRAMQQWLTHIPRIATEYGGGPVFRGFTPKDVLTGTRYSDRGVARTVAMRAYQAGLDPEKLSAHSLRAGFATAAAKAGAHERQIANQTGHKDMSVVRRYIRSEQPFDPDENAVFKLEL